MHGAWGVPEVHGGEKPPSSLGLHVPPPIIPQAQWCREVS